MMVVDASVAAKWLLNEPGMPAAMALLETERELIAPSLIEIEVLGAVMRRFRESKLSAKAARRATEFWRRLISEGQLQLVPTEDLLSEAIDLALSHRHGLQDCLYVALAVQLDCELVTADRQLQERMSEFHRIRPLGGA